MNETAAPHPASARGHRERVAVMPGSFRPFTVGHHSIACRALRLFDRLVIAVGRNDAKTESAANEVEANVESIRRVFAGDGRVEVVAYDGLTVDLARRLGAVAMVRGARSVADFEYERSIADVNRRLDPEIETVILPALPEHAAISSSVVRDLRHHGADVSAFLPPAAGTASDN